MRRWRKDWRRRGQLSRPNRRCVVRRLRRDGILQRRGLRIVLFVLAVLVWGATWQTRQRTANLGPWTCARIARRDGPLMFRQFRLNPPAASSAIRSVPSLKCLARADRDPAGMTEALPGMLKLDDDLRSIESVSPVVSSQAAGRTYSRTRQAGRARRRRHFDLRCRVAGRCLSGTQLR